MSSRPAAPRAFRRARINIEDFRIDYELFSETLPDDKFPKGANWLMLGPSGPRRLRLAVEHLAQYRGGICFCVDLDPRWVIKLIKKGWMEHLEAYKKHVIDQALTILGAGHDIKCMFTTPKLLEALACSWNRKGTTIRQAGHHRHLLRRHRVHAAVDPLRASKSCSTASYMTPTYGNTLMGLAASAPSGPHEQLQDHLLRPAAARRRRGRRLRRSRQGRRLRPDRPREADDADQGVLHARLPGARRGRARAADANVTLGRRQRCAAVPWVRGDDDGRRVLRLVNRCSACCTVSGADRRSRIPIAAREVCRIVRVALSLVCRNLRIRAQRTRPIDHAVGQCVAMICSGATPFSTHCSSAACMSNVFGPGPPPQCAMPGAMNSR